MGRRPVLEAALYNRHDYLWQDPVRFGCVVCALLLVFLPILPTIATLFVLLVVQLSAVALVSRFSLAGWSWQWGKRLHPGILASSMCRDWTNMSACTLVGAMLFLRHFGGPEALRPLGLLVVAVCLLPDARLCRWLLASDPGHRSDHLRDGFFWRDPVKLGAMLSWAVVCWIDRSTLPYLLWSAALLQFNSLVVLLDKYLSEIEVARPRGWECLFWEAEGRRLIVGLSPLSLLPVRHWMGDGMAIVLAATFAGLIVVPDLIRYALMIVQRIWEWVWRPRTRDATLVGILRG